MGSDANLSAWQGCGSRLRPAALAEQGQDSDGRIYQHLVCSDCMELVERERASEHVHECSGGPPISA